MLFPCQYSRTCTSKVSRKFSTSQGHVVHKELNVIFLVCRQETCLHTKGRSSQGSILVNKLNVISSQTHLNVCLCSLVFWLLWWCWIWLKGTGEQLSQILPLIHEKRTTSLFLPSPMMAVVASSQCVETWSIPWQWAHHPTCTHVTASAQGNI